MRRITRVFQWGFVAMVCFMAGARGTHVEMLGAAFMVFGFLAWALIGYAHAWVLAISDISERRRAAAMAARVEVMPGRCLCQSQPGYDGRCSLGVCRGY